MDRPVRLWGWGLSLFGTLFQLSVVLAAIPQLRTCFGCSPIGTAAEPPEAVDTWRPFIENPGGDFDARREPRCPEPQGKGSYYDLAGAPLPASYDPHAYGGRRIYACVLVDSEGEVLGARMIGGTGRIGLDRHLLWTIRRSWRFRPDAWAEGLSWQRVRLNSGPADGSVHAPLSLL
jgi:hypothetical protein